MKVKNKVEYTVLKQTETSEVETLLGVYRKDRVKAGIMFRMMREGNAPKGERLVVFRRNKYDWAICLYNKSWGINKNNTLYSSEKLHLKVTFVKGKLWTRWGNGRVKSFQAGDVHLFNSMDGGKLVREVIIKNLPFMENFFTYGVEIPFTTIRSKKLYNLNRIIRHKYNIPLSRYKTIKDLSANQPINMSSISERLVMLRKSSALFKNCDLINLDCLTSKVWNDTLRFARVLGKVIDCKWSVKRFEMEHNNWSKEIVRILYEGDRTPLKITDKFSRFAEYSGYRLLVSADELYAEGLTNSHCVASYAPKVNSGECAIFHHKGGTLELTPSYGVSGGVRVTQFLGWRNSDVSGELKSEVETMVKEYNDMLVAEAKTDMVSDGFSL